MTVQTCMAGRNIPIRQLIRRILTSRGHAVDDASNPVECIEYYTRGDNFDCRLMIVEFTGPETLEMIDASIERTGMLAENIAVLSLNGVKGAQEVTEHGCYLVRQPFSIDGFVRWVALSEKRCARRAA